MLDELSPIGSFREFAEVKKAKKLQKEKKTLRKSRHVLFQTVNYQLLRAGVPVANEEKLNQLFSADQIEESMFYIFKNIDSNCTRGPNIPLYEACYLIADGNYFILAQKKHMKRAYSKLGRSEAKNMWLILENGLPYWVDRHAYSKQAQCNSKKKHESKRARKNAG